MTWHRLLADCHFLLWVCVHLYHRPAKRTCVGLSPDRAPCVWQAWPRCIVGSRCWEMWCSIWFSVVFFYIIKNWGFGFLCCPLNKWHALSWSGHHLFCPLFAPPNLSKAILRLDQGGSGSCRRSPTLLGLPGAGVAYGDSLGHTVDLGTGTGALGASWT